MIFHRRDADAQQFMYLAVTEFVHPVHEENAPRLWRHGVNRGFVQSQQVRRFEVPFLRRRRRAVAFLAERKEGRSRGLLATRAIDKKILGDTAKKPARIDELVALGAPRGASKDFLHQIGRFLGSRFAAQEMEERYAMRPIYRVQIVPGFRLLLDRRRTIGRMGMAGRGHRKRVTRRGTVAAGTGRHDINPGGTSGCDRRLPDTRLPVLCRRSVACADHGPVGPPVRVGTGANDAWRNIPRRSCQRCSCADESCQLWAALTSKTSLPFRQRSWLSTRMPRERPGVGCRIMRALLMIAEQEAPNVRLWFGFGDRVSNRIILRVDIGEDRGIEMTR